MKRTAMTMVAAAGVFAATVGGAVPTAAGQRGSVTRAPATTPPSDVSCFADLGTGVETHRRYCDVLITTDPTRGVVLAIPKHTGTSTLQFDLHNRFPTPAPGASPATIYARHVALVSILNPAGGLLGHAAVTAELRTAADLFDHLVGSRPDSVKLVSPGAPTSVKMTLPAAVTAVSIVGVRLEVLTRLGRQVYLTPDRPIAMVSNLRAEYRPAR